MKDEKQIEKILREYGIDDNYFVPEIAKEIASLYEGWYPGDYSRWKDRQLTMNVMSYDKDQDVYIWNQKVWNPIDLFKYWKDEVEGK